MSHAYHYQSVISRSMVLERFSQEEIFGWCLKDIVTTGRKYCNPLRDDKHADCYFIYAPDGTLYFWDWASVPNHWNCFQFYSRMYGISYELVYDHIWMNVDDCAMYSVSVAKPAKTRVRKMSSTTDIDILPKEWSHNELTWWRQYGITQEQLDADKVIPVKAVMITSDGESKSMLIKGMGYAYTEFESGHKKIYQPFERRLKWFTNCTANDIGGMKSLPKSGYNLIITKSYKDCRVIRNLGWNCIWFQNEGMCPSADVLEKILPKFNRVYVFYDNDKPGIAAAEKIKDMLLKHNGMTRCFHLPEKLYDKGIKDSSDFVKAISYNKLNEFIKVKLEAK